MKRELTPNEIKFDISIDKNIEKSNNVPEYEDAFAKIKRALKITKEGYNLYLVDSFSKNKLKDLINFIEDEYKDLDPPKDICYVTLEDENKPEAIFVANGKGKKLKETVSNIKKSYLDVIDDFYSDSTNDEKDFLSICENSKYIIGLEIPDPIKYKFNNEIHRYCPDFLLELDSGFKVMVEIKANNLLNDKKVIMKRLYAKKWCKENNVKYITLTEKDIYSYFSKTTRKIKFDLDLYKYFY